jgi:hypothetical protein
MLMPMLQHSKVRHLCFDLEAWQKSNTMLFPVIRKAKCCLDFSESSMASYQITIDIFLVIGDLLSRICYYLFLFKSV